MGSLVMAHVVMTTPYVMRTVTSTMRAFDYSLEEAAMNLGANRLRAFWEVTFPVIMPGIVSGAMFAFITSFGDSVVALFLSSPTTVTLPVKIFTDIMWNFEPSIAAISTVSSVLAIGGVMLIYVIQGTRAFVGKR
jgi:putative spermidine/putrescine transport system permease protein